MNQNQEIWRSINNFPNHEVSNHGRVRKAINGMILRGTITKGYKIVNIDKKLKRVHVLVAQEFIENNDISKTMVDHIDHDKLNNHVSNLRFVTPSQNQMNRQKGLGTSSKYKGTSWSNRANKWEASICINGKHKHLGNYDNEEEAAEAYNDAAEEYFGEYAHLNELD